MALTADYDNRVIHSDASITDVPAFHLALRVIEATPRGMREPPVHDYSEIDLGSGAFFPAVDFIGGWSLEFPDGVFEVRGGNINAPVVTNPGTFLKVTQSAAYAVTSIGAGGATPEDVADAVVAKALGARTLGAHIQAIAATQVGETTGAGTSHMTYTDGPVTIEADVPLPGVAGDRTNVVIGGV